MFSRAERFNYPKPEVASPECHRCTQHHKSLCHNSTMSRYATYTKTPKSEKIVKTKKPSEDKTSKLKDKINQMNRSYPSEIPNVNVEVRQIASSAMASSVSLSTEDVLHLSFSSDDNITFDKVVHCSTKPQDEKLIKKIDFIEKKIETQRKRIEGLRNQLFSASSDEGFNSSRSPSPTTDIQQRMKHLEDVSRFCVKETLDFIVMYNKTQEEKCEARPQDYKDLVEFCSDLIVEVSAKLSGDRVNRDAWKKVRVFIKRVLSPFRKMSHFVRHS